MKKEFTRVALVSAGAILLLPLPFMGGFNRMRDYLLGVGITALGIGIILLVTGFILVLIESSRKYGQAFLLTAALLFLASFTLCSTGGGLFG